MQYDKTKKKITKSINFRRISLDDLASNIHLIEKINDVEKLLKVNILHFFRS